MASTSWRTTRRIWPGYDAPLVALYNSILTHCPPSPKRVLDIGCGNGRLTYILAETMPMAFVAGVDSDKHEIAAARREVLRRERTDISFEVVGGETLPGAGRNIDLIVMANKIGHAACPETRLANIAERLAPTGRAIITTPNRSLLLEADDSAGVYDAPSLKSLLLKHFRDVKVYGSWRMRFFSAWKAGRAARAILDIQSRFGFNPFEEETENPSDEWCQLTAVCAGPR